MQKKRESMINFEEWIVYFSLRRDASCNDYYARSIPLPRRDRSVESSRNLVSRQRTGGIEGRGGELVPNELTTIARAVFRSPPPPYSPLFPTNALSLPFPLPSLSRRSVFSMNSGRRTSCIAIFYFRNASSFLGNGS